MKKHLKNPKSLKIMIVDTSAPGSVEDLSTYLSELKVFERDSKAGIMKYSKYHYKKISYPEYCNSHYLNFKMKRMIRRSF